MFDDVLSGIGYLESQGLADPERIGVYGFSNGATTANYLLTRTALFKCAVSVNGRADWLHSFLLWTDDDVVPVVFGGRRPWDDMKAYLNLSPVYHLDKVTTPMLLVAGDKDSLTMLDYIEMFNGLRSLRREVTLVGYPQQGHAISGSDLLDFWKRVYVFFDQHLKPEVQTDQESGTSNLPLSPD